VIFSENFSIIIDLKKFTDLGVGSVVILKERIYKSHLSRGNLVQKKKGSFHTTPLNPALTRWLAPACNYPGPNEIFLFIN
jgi:hypothetical protein